MSHKIISRTAEYPYILAPGEKTKTSGIGNSLHHRSGFVVNCDKTRLFHFSQNKNLIVEEFSLNKRIPHILTQLVFNELLSFWDGKVEYVDFAYKRKLNATVFLYRKPLTIGAGNSCALVTIPLSATNVVKHLVSLFIR